MLKNILDNFGAKVAHGQNTMKKAKQAPEIIHFRGKAKALCKALVTVLKQHKEALKKNILLTL